MRGRLAALGALLLVLTTFLGPAKHTSAADPGGAPGAADRDEDEDRDRDKDEDEEPERLPQGLKLTFRAIRAGTPSSRPEDRDVRLARLVALNVPAGEPPTPFLPAGPFEATWEGTLTVNLPADSTFSAACRGAVRVAVNGKVALAGSGSGDAPLTGESVRLKSGNNKLQVQYTSPSAGDAVLRLFWTAADIPREPLPIAALGHDATAADLVAGLRLREGRGLVAALRCLKCHQAKGLPATGGMPDLDLDAPALADAGARLRPEWLARWIEDPRSLRADASMPRLLHGPQAPASARDVAAYLATLAGAAEAEEPAPPTEAAGAGGRLFANLGCIGCHTLPGFDGWKQVADRVPLRNVGAKWRPGALRAFLIRPDRHYASIRMPNFHLTEAEAAVLAAFVLAPPRVDLGPPPLPAADAGRGKGLVQSSGCLNCHALESVPNQHRAPDFADLAPDAWARGCVAPGTAPGRAAPDFGLTDARRRAIAAFAADRRKSLARESPIEAAERQVTTLRCVACHRRDGADDVWTESRAEVDPLLAAPAPPEPGGPTYPELQARPQLTWVGEKLKPEWMEAFIAGTVPSKPRPYLRARMPAFAKWAAPLTRGLVLEHGSPPASPPDAAPDPAQAALGKSLARANGGLACVSCHQVGKAEAVGVFEAPGVNFQYVKGRLRKDYYDRWVRNPLRVDPETKMPTFFSGDRSVLPGILGGDAAGQAEAIWNYLLQGAAIEAPDR